MNFIPKVLRKIAWEKQSIYKIEALPELPIKIDDKTIYIVGEHKHPWLLAFNCPCGCKSLIQLNLLKEADPCWHFMITNKKKINIYPSVRKINGCKSHFVIRKGKIEWFYANIKTKLQEGFC
jgi:hypothetical protein